MTVPLGRIHLIADLDVLSTLEDPTARVVALLKAGLPSLTLRGIGRDAAELVRSGRELRAAARDHGAFFVVNGPAEATEKLQADGRHLPAVAPPPPSGFDLPWGRSVHDAAELAAANGAQWIFVSPVFGTASKPGAATLGAAGLAELVHRAGTLPVYALGGVTRENTVECLASGVAGVAAIRGLLGPGGPTWIRELLSR